MNNLILIIHKKAMIEQDKLIASLRQQLRQALNKCSALEQENALLIYELEKLQASGMLYQDKNLNE